MKYLLKVFIFSSITLLASCGGLIKSEYAPITYYRLQATPPAKNIAVMPGTLMVRTFYTNAQYDSDDMYTTNGGAISNPYEYHKWVSATPELVTDFIINRLTQYKAFTKGVVPSGSASAADYILEGKVLDMIAETDERGSNVAHVQLQVSLVRVKDNSLIMQKLYDKRINRTSTAIQSIADAMSAAMSEITDEIAADMAVAIR
jgi:ABC-type uncharacterized transport system auxiliary subunit